MSHQKTFEIVAKHLLQQNARSTRHNKPGFCAYRGEGGYKCAVGVLIPDEEYSPRMEGGVCYRPLVKASLIKHGHDPEFCQELQLIHDTYLPSEWRKLLIQFGRNWRLDVSFLTQGENPGV